MLQQTPPAEALVNAELAASVAGLRYGSDGESGLRRVKCGTGFSYRDAAGKPVVRDVKVTTATAGLVDKGGFRHFMAKEIHEQPEVIAHTLAHYLDPDGPVAQIDDALRAAFASIAA